MGEERVCTPAEYSPWLGVNVDVDPHHLQLALDNPDAIQMALMLGRLDFASVLLAAVGIILALGAVFGYGFLNERAKRISQAETTATVPSALAAALPAALHGESGQEALKAALSDPVVLARIDAYISRAGLDDTGQADEVDTDPGFGGGGGQ